MFSTEDTSFGSTFDLEQGLPYGVSASEPGIQAMHYTSAEADRNPPAGRRRVAELCKFRLDAANHATHQEVLMREMHHREASSLQMVVGPLPLKARTAKSANVRLHPLDAYGWVMAITAAQSQVTPSESSVIKKVALEPLFLNHLRNELSFKNVRRVVMHEPLSNLRLIFFVQFANGTPRTEVWRGLQGAAAKQAECGKIVIANQRQYRSQRY